MTIPTTAISARATGLPPQAIREVMEVAWRRPDALHLEVGEPGFPTPAHIVEAAARAARDGHTKYTPNAGIAPLREALAEKVGRVDGYEATPEQIVVGARGVQILHNVLLALTDPEDEILLPDPGGARRAASRPRRRDRAARRHRRRRGPAGRPRLPDLHRESATPASA
jgi:DNA-binding transcriptional MocR family regulator